MEDSHAYANSLQWGPDGWLYGAQGSTVTAKIRGNEFQQGIWRYHPITKEFELFSEGGGNTWGLDFDKNGQIIAGTNYGNVAMLHQVQGAYYVKGFSKHGALHNPHTYGYFEHMPFKNFKGGHVTNGGIVYQADLYPQEYRNRYIAGNLLSTPFTTTKLKPEVLPLQGNLEATSSSRTTHGSGPSIAFKARKALFMLQIGTISALPILTPLITGIVPMAESTRSFPKDLKKSLSLIFLKTPVQNLSHFFHIKISGTAERLEDFSLKEKTLKAQNH